MKRYFTISEFAKLRNININSLRYYERIGILKPAHVDQHTGYRYYSPEQVPILDIILLCIDFGMPLKELAESINNDAFIQNRKLFETGRQIAQERIRNLQMELDKIEYTLQYLDVNQRYSNQTGSYERSISERTVITSDYTDDLADVRKIEIASGKLYNYAQEKRLSPVFPAGMIVERSGGKVCVKVFFEIICKDTDEPTVATLPPGRFSCRQVDLTPRMSLSNAIEAMIGASGDAQIIVSNMLLDKYQIGTKRSELQKRIAE